MAIFRQILKRLRNPVKDYDRISVIRRASADNLSGQCHSVWTDCVTQLNPKHSTRTTGNGNYNKAVVSVTFDTPLDASRC